MSITTNYQFQFGSFAFGSGTPFAVLDVDGLESFPALRVQDDDSGYSDGMFTGHDFFEGRNLVFTIHTFAGNGNSAQVNFNLLQTALMPQQQGTQALQFLLSPTETAKTIQARARVNRTMVDVDYTLGMIRSQWQFFCPDPRYFDVDSTLVQLSPSPIGGRSYSKVFSYSYGGGSNQIQTYTTNLGRTIAGGVITIVGPVTNPNIGSVTQNKYLTVNTTLASTDTLKLDLTSKIVTLTSSITGVTTNVRNLLSNGSSWFDIQPGLNALYFTGTSVTVGTTSASITYSNAYI
jgi:Phage tail protein